LNGNKLSIKNCDDEWVRVKQIAYKIEFVICNKVDDTFAAIKPWRCARIDL